MLKLVLVAPFGVAAYLAITAAANELALIAHQLRALVPG